MPELDPFGQKRIAVLEKAKQELVEASETRDREVLDMRKENEDLRELVAEVHTIHASSSVRYLSFVVRFSQICFCVYDVVDAGSREAVVAPSQAWQSFGPTERGHHRPCCGGDPATGRQAR